MCNSTFDSLILTMPEIIPLFGIVILLILKIFNLKDMRLMSHCAIPFLIISIYSLCKNYITIGSGYAFNDSISYDTFTYFSQGFLLFASLLIFLMLAGSEKMQGEIPILLLASVLGGMIIIASNDFIILYLGIELASFSLYLCVASRTSNTFSLESGIKYFILGSAVSGIYLFGAALIYISCGYLSFNDVAGANSFVQLYDSGILAIPMAFWIGIIMILISLCFKLSIAPFHLWAPDVYQGSPAIISAFIGTISKISAVAILMKLVCCVFDLMLTNIQQILMIVAVISMFIGSLGGIMQKSFRRMLAYSTITHMGFIVASLISISDDGLNNFGSIGAINYLLIYILLIVIPIFASIIYISKNNDINIAELSGLREKHPIIAFSLAILMLSSIGIPPFPGFFAKFYVLSGLIDGNMYSIACCLVLMSVLSSFYYLRVIKYMYFVEDSSNDMISKSNSDNQLNNTLFKIDQSTKYQPWELKLLIALGFCGNILYPVFAIDQLFNLSIFIVDTLF